MEYWSCAVRAAKHKVGLARQDVHVDSVWEEFRPLLLFLLYGISDRLRAAYWEDIPHVFQCRMGFLDYFGYGGGYYLWSLFFVKALVYTPACTLSHF